MKQLATNERKNTRGKKNWRYERISTERHDVNKRNSSWNAGILSAFSLFEISLHSACFALNHKFNISCEEATDLKNKKKKMRSEIQFVISLKRNSLLCCRRKTGCTKRGAILIFLSFIYRWFFLSALWYLLFFFGLWLAEILAAELNGEVTMNRQIFQQKVCKSDITTYFSVVECIRLLALGEENLEEMRIGQWKSKRRMKKNQIILRQKKPIIWIFGTNNEQRAQKRRAKPSK